MDQADKKPTPRPPGRPRSMQGDVTTVNLRMTREQRAKLDLLGGAAWVRDMIEKAKTPTA